MKRIYFTAEERIAARRRATKKAAAKRKARDPAAFNAMKMKYYYRRRDAVLERAHAKKAAMTTEQLAAEKIARNARRDAKLERLAGRRRPDFCEVCGRPPKFVLGNKLHWDHCHQTGAFRGWLCGQCNSAMGHCDDNPEILRALANYLERHDPAIGLAVKQATERLGSPS